jgi:hypothetical protein
LPKTEFQLQSWSGPRWRRPPCPRTWRRSRESQFVRGLCSETKKNLSMFLSCLLKFKKKINFKSFRWNLNNYFWHYKLTQAMYSVSKQTLYAISNHVIRQFQAMIGQGKSMLVLSAYIEVENNFSLTSKNCCNYLNCWLNT